jgi:hypothetical protein
VPDGAVSSCRRAAAVAAAACCLALQCLSLARSPACACRCARLCWLLGASSALYAAGWLSKLQSAGIYHLCGVLLLSPAGRWRVACGRRCQAASSSKTWRPILSRAAGEAPAVRVRFGVQSIRKSLLATCSCFQDFFCGREFRTGTHRRQVPEDG